MLETIRIRNVAMIAHVDHGKTTLVDALLQQSSGDKEDKRLVDRVMDSTDLEREKGITILAKNASVTYENTKINIIDTPGHADFGGEVERGLAMVDGVVLLVDASEGPLPQTRFVLRKALELNLSIILVINKIDRADARVAEVIDEVYELFFDLGATEEQIDFPIVYCSARSRIASRDLDTAGSDMKPLFELFLNHIPAPQHSGSQELQALVTNLDSSPHLGRLAVCRVVEGKIQRGQIVSHCRRDGTIENAKISELFTTEGLDRVAAERAGPGDIIAVAGMPDITIGETLADQENPTPLPLITVDEPTMSMTIGINTSPLAGKEGSKLTPRMLANRLESEVIGNVSLKVSPADRSETWIVQGRGELQLAVLIETMRREGFELTVGKPEVVTKELNGKIHEPMEHLFIETDEEYVGAITQSLAKRKGQLKEMNSNGNGSSHIEFEAPVRGLIGFQTEFLTNTRGTGIINRLSAGFVPWLGEIRTRGSGSLISDRPGPSTTHALVNLQERGKLFIGPGVATYEGMIVGENARADDMDVNPCREKKLTNMRSSAADTAEHLTPNLELSLEQALEFIAADECLEVTPGLIRLRKVTLDTLSRNRETKRSRKVSV